MRGLSSKETVKSKRKPLCTGLDTKHLSPQLNSQVLPSCYSPTQTTAVTGVRHCVSRDSSGRFAVCDNTRLREGKGSWLCLAGFTGGYTHSTRPLGARSAGSLRPALAKPAPSAPELLLPVPGPGGETPAPHAPWEPFAGWHTFPCPMTYPSQGPHQLPLAQGSSKPPQKRRYILLPQCTPSQTLPPAPSASFPRNLPKTHPSGTQLHPNASFPKLTAHPQTPASHPKLRT